MNRKFKTPAQDDASGWQIVRFLFDHGFRFGAIIDETGKRVPYPQSLAEAREFVRSYGHEASARRLSEDVAKKRAVSRHLRRGAGEPKD